MMATRRHLPRAPGPRLKKRYGQHHLVDGGLCRPLIDFLDPSGQRVVEVGPGGGVLTRELLSAGARVMAWEVDLEWATHLSALRRCHRELTVVAGDVLDQPWGRFPTPTLVTGNLPFNVGTRIIENLLPHAERVPRAAFMVQKEVADRLVARPGSKAYGGLSVLVAVHARVRYLGTVKPGSFHPPPKVSAAFVGFELRATDLDPPALDRFNRLVRLAFARRRKTLRNNLGEAWGREGTATILDLAGIDGGRRAETLELEEWRHLLRAVDQLDPPSSDGPIRALEA